MLGSQQRRNVTLRATISRANATSSGVAAFRASTRSPRLRAIWLLLILRPMVVSPVWQRKRVTARFAHDIPRDRNSPVVLENVLLILFLV